MADLIFLGRTNWRDRRRLFGLKNADRRAHMYIVGKTGTGKSSLLEMMIRQDVVNGRGLALLDPHGDLAERIERWIPAARRGDLIYLDVPNPAERFTFNPLEGVPPLRRSLAANGIVEAMKKIFADSWGYRLEYILRAALLLLLDQDEATLADIVRLFHEPEFRTEAAARATNLQVRRFWTTEFEAYGSGKFRVEAVSPIENKIGSFLLDPYLSRILTTKKSTVNVREVLDEGKILLVNLAKGKLGESPAMLFGSLLVSAIGLAGLSRADMPESARRDFVLYLDEFHTFTTLALANMAAELRKYALPMVLTNQHLEQLPPELRSAILGNVGTLVVFRVGASDAAKLAKELGPAVKETDLVFLPNRSFFVRALVDGAAIEAFTGTTLDVPKPSLDREEEKGGSLGPI